MDCRVANAPRNDDNKGLGNTQSLQGALATRQSILILQNGWLRVLAMTATQIKNSQI